MKILTLFLSPEGAKYYYFTPAEFGRHGEQNFSYKYAAPSELVRNFPTSAALCTD